MSELNVDSILSKTAVCQHCGSKVKTDAQFCQNCGQPVAATSAKAFCEKCGHELNDNGICKKCDEMRATNDNSS